MNWIPINLPWCNEDSDSGPWIELDLEQTKKEEIKVLGKSYEDMIKEFPERRLEIEKIAESLPTFKKWKEEKNSIRKQWKNKYFYYTYALPGTWILINNEKTILLGTGFSKKVCNPNDIITSYCYVTERP